MTWIELRDEIQNYLLQDPLQRKWKPEDVECWMNEAQLKYVEATGVLTATVPIVPDVATGLYFYPDNFLELIYAYNDDDLEIEPSTYEELLAFNGSNFDSTTGMPLYIYDNDSDELTYKLHPTPVLELEGSSEYDYEENQPWGIIQWYDDGTTPAPQYGNGFYGITYQVSDGSFDQGFATQYGVSMDGPDYAYDPLFGVAVDGEGVYGTEQIWTDVEIGELIDPTFWFASPGEIQNAINLPGGPIGTLHYVRKPTQDTIEVSDVEAIKYYAASMAYKQESAWKDLAYSDALMSEFDTLIHKESPVAKIKQSNINFF